MKTLVLSRLYQHEGLRYEDHEQIIQKLRMDGQQSKILEKHGRLFCIISIITTIITAVAVATELSYQSTDRTLQEVDEIMTFKHYTSAIAQYTRIPATVTFSCT